MASRQAHEPTQCIGRGEEQRRGELATGKAISIPRRGSAELPKVLGLYSREIVFCSVEAQSSCVVVPPNINIFVINQDLTNKRQSKEQLTTQHYNELFIS